MKGVKPKDGPGAVVASRRRKATGAMPKRIFWSEAIERMPRPSNRNGRSAVGSRFFSFMFLPRLGFS